VVEEVEEVEKSEIPTVIPLTETVRQARTRLCVLV